MSNTTYRKKLIEVALPLEAINRESAREKSIRHGHPSTLHLWWSRKPLATCRAVLFAQLVDDPSSHPDKFPTDEAQKKERERLFKIIEELVKWENINNERVLQAAREEILKSTGGSPPPVLDPFCGGGSIPLEAQRLGLKAYASDLNPVAVLITKALIEIPPNFAGMPPVHPGAQRSSYWHAAKGLAEDVRYYGKWILDEAEKRIGHLYPDFKLPKEYGGAKAKIIAWLWTRTVKCPNPACGAQMPLASKFWLSKKKNKQAWVVPIIMGSEYRFEVREGTGRPREGIVNRHGATCLCCKAPVPLNYLRAEGKADRMNNRLMAIVVKADRRRLYFSPDENTVPTVPTSNFLEEIKSAEISGYFNPPLYGFKSIGSMFTPRQKLALETFSELVQKAKEQCMSHCHSKKYAEAIAVYLTLGVGRLSNRLSSFSIWNTIGEKIEQTFSEQGVGMAWDFAEVNPFSGSTGSWEGSLEWIPKCIDLIPGGVGKVIQRDAGIEFSEPLRPVISTDPPYYSNITYADFADFFYGTFRASLKTDFPDLFSTMTTPKASEIVAAWHRFGGNRHEAGEHFRKKLQAAIEVMLSRVNDSFPITIYYAFKEAELDDRGNGFFTAWESILSVLIEAGLQVVHTWPFRTERTTGRKAKKNTLASSIVLVCRKKTKDALLTTRRDFINSLKRELPFALRQLLGTNIAPIDLAQSSIGPGMAVFSRYSKVLEADGTPMRVRSALALINQVLDEYLAEQESEYDADTRWALAWFEEYGTEEGPYGVAETLSKAKNIAVAGLVAAGVIVSKAGKVRILCRDELPDDWDPTTDKRLTVWEVTQHLIRALVDKGSEEAAAALLRKVGALGDVARDLAYRLYTICDRKKWAQEALAYNSLVVAWPELIKLAGQRKVSGPPQQELFQG